MRYVLRGRISKVWAKFVNFEIQQQQREGRLKKFKYKTAESWGIKLVLILLTQIMKRWEGKKEAVQLTYKRTHLTSMYFTRNRVQEKSMPA